MGLPAGMVTFVFTDVEGSTELFERIGAGYVRIQALQAEILRSAMARHGGVEVKTIGDGLFVAFAEPRSAVEACASAQRALSAVDWPEGAAVRVRMGVHVGPADPQDGDYVALAVNQAARVCGAAHGGQVLLSDGVVSMLAPDTPTRALGRFMLRGFATPIALLQLCGDGLGGTFPPPRARPVARHNLPIERTPFIGRAADRDAVVRALGRSRLVTICGPGGAGKTRLAYESAGTMVELLADGVWRVELAGVPAPDLVAGAVADTLGLPADGADPGLLAAGLADRELLLVLDNCEHVIEGAAALCDAILSAAPDLRVLATSREPLGVDGEASVRVAGLVEADARRLVYERVAAVRGDFVPDAADEAAVGELLARLDGLPLALELAAARASAMTLPEIAAGLRDPLALLASIRRGATERHGSLRAVIEWSHELLDTGERALFRRLAVLAGPVELGTVGSVCRGLVLAGADVAGTLVRLVDRNLVVAESRGGITRYRLLEPVRAYALEQLEQAGELAEARRHLLAWAVELAEAYHDGRGDVNALRHRVAAEHGAMLGALVERTGGHHDPEGALRLTGALARRWAIDRPAEAVGLLERALQEAPDGAPGVRLRALSGLARVLDMLTQFEESMEREEQALALAEEVGPSPDVVWSLATLATHLAFVNRHREADARLAEAETMATHLGDDLARAIVWRRRAYVLRARGEYTGARHAGLEDLALGERGNDDEAILGALVEVGIAANYAGDAVAAAAYGERAIQLAREHGFARAECLALTIVQLASTLSGRYERAAEAMAEALVLARGHRLSGLIRDCLDFTSVLLEALGRPEDAALALGTAAAYPRDSTNPRADAAAARIRETLGEATFAAATGRGALMAPEALDGYLLAAVAGAAEATPVELPRLARH